MVPYRPQRSWGKVMFLHASVILFTGGGGIPACIAGGIPACLAAGLRGRGGIPACLAGFQAHTQGEVEESGQGGSPGPHPRGKLRGLTWGWGLQAHTWGQSPGPHLGVSRPTPAGGLQAHTQGGCIPACTEADPPNSYCCGRYTILLECILV